MEGPGLSDLQKSPARLPKDGACEGVASVSAARRLGIQQQQ